MGRGIFGGRAGPATDPYRRVCVLEIVTSGIAGAGQKLFVVGLGSEVVGSFYTWTELPEPIQVTTDLRPGTVFYSTEPVTIAWKGGRPGDVVNVRIMRVWPWPEPYLGGWEIYAPVEQGSVTLEPWVGDKGKRFGFPPGEAVVVVRYLPGDSTKFSAKGLTMEAEHRWM